MIRHIGGGGFADVFLYRQMNLDRDVAVKVLLAADSSPAARRRFEAEGQVMARLSEEHQNIVPVYDASICADGRPYLVMQYCPLDDLSKRYKAAAIPITEVLSIGVQLSGAVESAHRQGILHRDIKPANVLTKRYGRPALTDFGIAVTTGAADDPDAVGVSIPWSPPELLADNPAGDVRSDVYSLTATLYTLLARRSPFEVPGRSNDVVDLLNRIARGQAPQTGNGRVPRSLERLLARGLDKDPSCRFPSAQVLARELQKVETELGGPVTNFEFLADNPGAVLAELPDVQADHTRVRPIVIRAQHVRRDGNSDATTMKARSVRAPIWPQPGPVSSNSGQAGTKAVDDRTQMRGGPTGRAYLDPHYLADPVPVAAVVPATPTQTSAPVSAGSTSRRPRLVIAGAGAIVAGALTWIVISNGTQPPPVPDPSEADAGTSLAVIEVVPPPIGLTGQPTADGIVFRWANPDPRPGDGFDWRRTDLAAEAPDSRVVEPAATVAGTQQACIEVVIVRDNGSSSAHPAESCVGK